MERIMHQLSRDQPIGDFETIWKIELSPPYGMTPKNESPVERIFREFTGRFERTLASGSWYDLVGTYPEQLSDLSPIDGFDLTERFRIPLSIIEKPDESEYN